MRFTSILPGYRTCSFQYQLNSVGSIQPCCHHGAGNYSYAQSITVQSGTHSLLGRESAHAVKCLVQGHSAKARQPRPVPKTFRSKVAGHSHCALTPCMYMEYIVSMYRDTEGSHCQGACRPQWFFYVPLNVNETAPPFSWSCEPREIHSL